MHIPEKKSTRLVSPKRTVLALIGFSLLTLIWVQINAFGTETVVSHEDLIISVAEKGDLIRDVRAPGTLVPVELNFLAASSSGRVEKILLEAGDAVEVGTVIMTLNNLELSQAVDAASYELEIRQAAYSALEQRLHQDSLKQRITVADIKTRYEMANLRRKANQGLVDTGVVSSIQYNEFTLLEEQLKSQLELEVELLESLPALRQAELAAAQAETNKAMRQLVLLKNLADDLVVKASTKGILQEVPVQMGEQIVLGTVLARIAGQDNLKAELKVQESQVKYVTKGQSVVISADGHVAKGIVRRIDPAVQQGVVVVDVYFTNDILVGARPDLRIDGVIELEHLRNVLKIKRPVFTQEYSTNSLFVLDEDQTMAERRQIEFGRGSVDVIEVLSMLNEGDRVVISDTSQYSDVTQIKLR